MAKNKMSEKYMSKIFGRYELDKKGKPKKDKLGNKIRKAYYKFAGEVDHISRKPSIGKHSDMNEMKAHRLKMLKKNTIEAGKLHE